VITATELSNQLRAELDRSVSAMRYIADMVEALDVSSPRMVDVPYRSQHDQDAQLSRVDCGPACVAMLLQWRGVQVVIDDITRETSVGPTNAGQLVAAAARHGLKLARLSDMTLAHVERAIEAGNPIVALVNYTDFGDRRQDTKYNGLHWLVVVGYDAQNIYINDPDYWSGRRLEGMQHPIARAVFEHAWDNTMPDASNRQALVIV